MKNFSDSLKLFLKERHDGKKLLSFFLCLLLFSGKAFSETRVFEEIGKAFIGDNQTKNDARNLAVLEAKRKALEKVGTYVSSLTVVENSVLKKDEIIACTQGFTSTEIIEEKPIVEGESFGLEVKARIALDTKTVEDGIKKCQQDPITVEQNKALVERKNELEAELQKAKEELAKLKSENEVKKYRETKVAKIEEKLSATEWYENGIALYLKNQTTEAIKSFTKAIEIDAVFGNAYFFRGATYLADTHSYNKPENRDIVLDKAIDDFTMAIKFLQDHCYSYLFRADAYKLKLYFGVRGNTKVIQENGLADLDKVTALGCENDKSYPYIKNGLKNSGLWNKHEQ